VHSSAGIALHSDNNFYNARYCILSVTICFAIILVPTLYNAKSVVLVLENWSNAPSLTSPVVDEERKSARWQCQQRVVIQTSIQTGSPKSI